MLTIPTALKVEHEKLHAELSAATKLPGKTGQAAKQVAAVLHEHFLSEEEFAMPPLALLVPIAEGRVTSEMRSVIPNSDRRHTLNAMRRSAASWRSLQRMRRPRNRCSTRLLSWSANT
jgi:hypothetical protein